VLFRSVNMYGDRLHIALEKKEFTAGIADQLRAKGFPVEGESEIIPSLEDVFISTVRKSEAGRQTG
jgi:ABC-2 type transport system ATP-binding protein